MFTANYHQTKHRIQIFAVNNTHKREALFRTWDQTSVKLVYITLNTGETTLPRQNQPRDTADGIVLTVFSLAT